MKRAEPYRKNMKYKNQKRHTGNIKDHFMLKNGKPLSMLPE